MPEPLITQATPDDLPHCASIYKEAFAAAPYYEEWRFDDARELLAALLQRDPETCFCLIYEGAVVGFAFCSTLGRFRAVVEEIALRPAFQGRGWGALLLEHCLSVFRQRGFPVAELIANQEAPAFAFYTRLGFRPARRNLLMLRDL